jgi:hypothetical protein
VPDLFPFERSDALGTAAGGGDPIQLARDRRREDDHAVAIPRAAAAGRGIAERHRRAPLGVDAVQLAPAKKPSWLLSGDQKGYDASSVPASGVIFVVARLRMYSDGFPCTSLATNASIVPSGEMAIPLVSNGKSARFGGVSIGELHEVARGRRALHRVHADRDRRDDGDRRDDPRGALAPRAAARDGSRHAGRGAALGDEAQLEHDVVRGLPAIVGILGQAGLHHAVERRRCHGTELRDRRRLRAENGGDQAGAALPSKARRPVAIS